MTELLISVRSTMEAEIALEAGADLIDVKEPSQGSLGRADVDVIQDVLQTVNGRRPVSAAWGELLAQDSAVPVPMELTYVKFGLSGCRDVSDWHARFPIGDKEPHWVYVAYADAELAYSPTVTEILHEACSRPGNVLLIDTFRKNGQSLLDWLNLDQLREIALSCQEHQVSLALAGSLGIAEMAAMLDNDVRPRWFAVRGAVCDQANRKSTLCAQRASELCDWLKQISGSPKAALLPSFSHPTTPSQNG